MCSLKYMYVKKKKKKKKEDNKSCVVVISCVSQLLPD